MIAAHSIYYFFIIQSRLLVHNIQRKRKLAQDENGDTLEGGSTLNGQKAGNESGESAMKPLPVVVEHNNEGGCNSVSPSPVASPLHLKHYPSQQTESTAYLASPLHTTLSPNMQMHHSSIPQLDLGDAAQKRLYSSSQVRTTDEIEQDYVYVYSDEDIKCWVCMCVCNGMP